MDRRKVLMLVAVMVCLPFAGEAFGQCPGGTCQPIRKAARVTYKGVEIVWNGTLDGVKRVAAPASRVGEVRKVTRRGLLSRVFRRR